MKEPNCMVHICNPGEVSFSIPMWINTFDLENSTEMCEESLRRMLKLSEEAEIIITSEKDE